MRQSDDPFADAFDYRPDQRTYRDQDEVRHEKRKRGAAEGHEGTEFDGDSNDANSDSTREECCDAKEFNCFMNDYCFSAQCATTPAVDLAKFPSLDLNGFRVHRVTDGRPNVMVIPDFLPPKLCEHIIETGRPSLKRSVTFKDDVNGVMTESDGRTSSDGSVAADDEVLAVLHSKLERLLGIPQSHFEGLVVLRYKGAKQRYLPHFDWFSPAAKFARSEQRVATFVLFLNDVPRGGELLLPRLGVKVRPRRGTAVVWDNVAGGGDGAEGFPETLHGGCPPAGRNTKWLSTIWIHGGPVSFHEESAEVPSTDPREGVAQ